VILTLAKTECKRHTIAVLVIYGVQKHNCVEAGSNTSTVTLQVVGGDEKGSLKSEAVKYGHESQGTWTRERLHW
jgi:hypothetical protein